MASLTLFYLAESSSASNSISPADFLYNSCCLTLPLKMLRTTTKNTGTKKTAKLRDYKRYYPAAEIGQTIYQTRKEAVAAPRPATVYQPR